MNKKDGKVNVLRIPASGWAKLCCVEGSGSGAEGVAVEYPLKLVWQQK